MIEAPVQQYQGRTDEHNSHGLGSFFASCFAIVPIMSGDTTRFSCFASSLSHSVYPTENLRLEMSSISRVSGEYIPE